MDTQLQRFQKLSAAITAGLVAQSLPEATDELCAQLAGDAAVFPPEPFFPKGVELVDPVNGLVTIDPVRYSNPDCAGQLFCVQPVLEFLDPESQAAYTVRQNVADCLSAENSGLGFHPRVRPMVATGDQRKFEYAPIVHGNIDRVPWLDDAWTVTGGTWDAVLTKISTGGWHKPTNTGANPHGHVAGA